MSNQEGFGKEFTILRELGEEVFVLRGSTIIVEILDDEELKTKGGLIIATDSKQTRGDSVSAHRLQVGRVLMTGPGYDGDDGEVIPLEVKPGAMVVLPQLSTTHLSMFPGIQRPTGNKLALVKEDNILCYYPTAEAYDLAKKKLN